MAKQFGIRSGTARDARDAPEIETLPTFALTAKGGRASHTRLCLEERAEQRAAGGIKRTVWPSAWSLRDQ